MPTPPPILAHLGHWYISLPTFMGPVLAIAIWLKVTAWRDKRRGDDRERLGVRTTHEEDRAIIAVRGPLNFPALLELEAELGAARTHSARVLLDLRQVTSAEENSVWRVPEILGEWQDDADVAVLLGSAPAQRELRKACALEGVEIVDDRGGGLRPTTPMKSERDEP
jgi:hypothetical protein